MDQIKAYLTKRKIIQKGVILPWVVLVVLAVGLIAGVYLVQQQTKLKPKAAVDWQCNGLNAPHRYCIEFEKEGGGTITVGSTVLAYVVGGEDDKSPRLDGTVSVSSPRSSGPASNCEPPESGFKNCWEFVIPNITSQKYTETFASEISDAVAGSPGRVTGSFTPQTAPAPPPPSPGNVGVGGTCSGSLTASCNPTKLSANWNVSEVFGPDTCNIFLEDPQGGNSSQLSSQCSGSWSGSTIPGIGAVGNGGYRLFVSNGDPAQGCYNKSVSSTTVNCPSPVGKVTIGGKVTRSDTKAGIPNVVINQGVDTPKTDGKECNIGTATTDSKGDYSFTNVAKDLLFCLRPPQVQGFQSPPPSYENLKASSDKTDYNFEYTPQPPSPPPAGGPAGVDVGTCESITIDGNDYKTSDLVKGNTYQVAIKMKNSKVGTSQTEWNNNYYLLYTGTSKDQLGLSKIKINVSKVKVGVDDFETFNLAMTPTAASTGDPTKGGGFQFHWEMRNDKDQPFLSGSGQCKPNFAVKAAAAVSSPSPTNVCSGSAGFIGGADRVWLCVPETVNPDTGEISIPSGCVGGSKDPNRACSGNLACYACLGGATQRPTITSFTADPTNVNVGDDITLTWTVSTGAAAAQSCFASGPWSGNKSISGGSEVVSAPSVSSRTTKTYTLTCQNPLGSDTKSIPVVVNPETGAPVVILTLTTPNNTDFINSGESVKLGWSVTSTVQLERCDASSNPHNNLWSGAKSTGGSQSIKLTNNTQTDILQSFTLTCRTTAGKSASQIAQVTVHPAAIVTCFVVSENRNTRNLFKNCAQTTIDNINKTASSVAGFLEDASLLADFQLSAGNVNKTLYARFLKLPQGESITTCTADKCKDTQAGVTLAVPVPSPSPSPVPTTCVCSQDNCTPSCTFTKLSDVTYNDPIKCILPAPIHQTVPTSTDKDGWCKRPTRTIGDADGDGDHDEDDYLYYLTATSGGKIPAKVNPDFDGDGEVGTKDLDIWNKAK